MKTNPLLSYVQRAAGVVVFCRDGRGTRVLVVRGAAGWDFPREERDSERADLGRAQRALEALTGLTALDYPFGDEHRETVPGATGGAIARYFLAECDEIPRELHSAPGSTAPIESRWVDFADAEDLLPPRLAVVLDWARTKIQGN